MPLLLVSLQEKINWEEYNTTIRECDNCPFKNCKSRVTYEIILNDRNLIFKFKREVLTLVSFTDPEKASMLFDFIWDAYHNEGFSSVFEHFVLSEQVRNLMVLGEQSNVACAN